MVIGNSGKFILIAIITIKIIVVNYYYYIHTDSYTSCMLLHTVYNYYYYIYLLETTTINLILQPDGLG